VVASVRCAGAVPTRIERDGSTPCARANASGSPGSGGRHQQLGGPAACRHNALSTGPETLAERRAATAASATDLPPRPYTYVVSLLAALALLVVPAVASAAKGFTEQVASARWSTPFQCPDGSTAADGRLIVETDNFIEAGTNARPQSAPQGRVRGPVPGRHLQLGLRTGGADAVRPGPQERAGQPGRVAHGSVDASWTGTGPIITTVNGPGSMRKERSATATATIVFDGNTLVNGAANFPFPAPFIRVDTEK
jgi:hypothetical protein